MKLTELHDDDPLVVVLLQKLLKNTTNVIECVFTFETDEIDGVLYDILRLNGQGLYLFQLTNDAATPNSINFGSRALEKMDLRKRQAQGDKVYWDLTYTERT